MSSQLFLTTISSALAVGIISAVSISVCQGESLDSLNKDEEGNLNPMLKWWIILSVIHVGIVYGWSYLLFNYGIIKLNEEYDQWWEVIVYFFAYWIIFESWYTLCHFSQHKIRFFGIMTGHKGELSEKFHHGMKAPYGPDFLTAFSAHPIDDFIVQQAAQFPWIISYFIGLSTGYYFSMSYLTYGIIISWLVFVGMRAHTRKSFGGANHCIHHDNPSNGPYSFSGIPEGILKKLN